MGHMMNVERDLLHLKNFANGDAPDRAAIVKNLSKIKLLTPDFANAKTAKNQQFSGYMSYIMHLSPADMAFKYIGRVGSLCPFASKGCKAACLNTAGRGRFDSIQLSRLRKSLYFILFKREFMSHLEKEINKLEAKARKANKQLVLRLNGTSDIPWESIKLESGLNVFQRFETIQFYDYTKVPTRLERLNFKNYFVVFSASESNDTHWAKALQLGFNVAMVFNEIPQEYNGVKVVNGDEHDFRFLDQGRGVIVGLKAKGKAKRDTSGFVKLVSPCTKAVA